MSIFAIWLGFLVCVVYLTGALMNAPPPWRSATGNWDTGYYVTLATEGYQTGITGGSNVAFFPLYPTILRWISWLGVDVVVAGVAVSLVSFLAALILLRRLLAERFSPEVARNALLLLVFWPFSFFFGVAYTESLFLLLTVGAFFFVHRERWWLGAACAGLASATRAVGVFVAVAVVLSYVQSSWRPTVRGTAKLVGLGLTGVSGLAAFMIFLELHTGSFLAFAEAQRSWPNRSEGIAGLRSIVVVLRDLPPSSYEFALLLVYMVPMLLFLVLAGYVFAKVDVVWGGFCLLTLLAPVPTGSLASTNRYVLVLFPCFAALAKLLGDRAVVVATASAGFLGLFAYHYAFHPRVFIG